MQISLIDSRQSAHVTDMDILCDGERVSCDSHPDIIKAVEVSKTLYNYDIIMTSL